MAKPGCGCCMPVPRDARVCCDNIMQSRYLTDLEWRVCHAVNIYIFKNGYAGDNPILVHIGPQDKRSMRRVLAVIDERISWQIGFSKRLYRMNGSRIKSPCDLEMYHNYVVASNFDPKFKCVNYGRIRSPLMYLHQESTHIRNLRIKNPYYDCWLLKKKAIYDERPQFIFPVYYTTDGLVPPDLPIGQLGNYRPCDEGCTVPIKQSCGLNKYLRKRCVVQPPCKIPCPGTKANPYHYTDGQYICPPRGDNSNMPQSQFATDEAPKPGSQSIYAQESQYGSGGPTSDDDESDAGGSARGSSSRSQAQGSRSQGPSGSRSGMQSSSQGQSGSGSGFGSSSSQNPGLQGGHGHVHGHSQNQGHNQGHVQLSQINKTLNQHHRHRHQQQQGSRTRTTHKTR